MNWVKANREILKKSNYILKANTDLGYWFGMWQRRVDYYQNQFNSNFNIILFGSERIESDFYVIPFIAIKDLLTDQNLYTFKEGKRWIGNIHNHVLKFRHSNVERNISAYFSFPESTYGAERQVSEILVDYAIENARREVSIRINQSIFRKNVLENFDYQCCLTGLKETNLLVASHIIPWAARLDTRLSPHNGLCLSTLYDVLFDRGYFTLSEGYKVIITERMNKLSRQTQKWLQDIRDRKMIEPRKHVISKSALIYHQENVFDRFAD